VVTASAHTLEAMEVMRSGIAIKAFQAYCGESLISPYGIMVIAEARA
jgi:hypothetical protein